jgi:UPF0716 protein FxsA
MPAVLVVVFLVVPLLELLVILQVGQAIGGWPTLGLLIAVSIFGAWIVRREGSRAWRALREALNTGRMPSRELADAALVLVGGTLLLTPGFLTDAMGLFFVLPLTRPIARRLLTSLLAMRFPLVGLVGGGDGPGRRSPPRTRSAGSAEPGSGHASGSRDLRVVRGEVVEDQGPKGPGPEGGPPHRDG